MPCCLTVACLPTKVILVLIKRNPFGMLHTELKAQAADLALVGLETVATVKKTVLRSAHETSQGSALRVPGFAKERTELQIRCRPRGGGLYTQGEVPVAGLGTLGSKGGDPCKGHYVGLVGCTQQAALLQQKQRCSGRAYQWACIPAIPARVGPSHVLC